uniref:Xylulose kinase-1 n=1 Tax=Tanacetum cinerariifolium TaxID=118510 RepID=A0A6L2JKV4_TANCI|nr:xylulose kinase-1 [Tanacetum cinerariifolium]
MSTPTFCKIHNLIAFLEKPSESNGFKQIVDFINANQIKYALTVSPTIYTLCIKQFWTTVKIKTVNDKVRLQALIDGKKVVITEASIRHDLKLNDAEGVFVNPCLTKKRKHKPRRKEKKETKVSPTEIHTEDHVPITSNYPLPSHEDRIKLKELMDLCKNLSNKVFDLETKVIEMKSSHKAKIKELESRVENIEEKNRSLIKELISFNTSVKSPSIKETIVDKEESSKQGRKIANIDADAEVNLKNVYNLDMAHEETVLSMQAVDVQSERIEDADVKKVVEEMVEVIEIAKIIINEVSTAGVKLNAANEKPVSAAHTNITIAQPSKATKTTVDITTAPKDKGIVFHDKEESTTRTASLKSQVKDKGKAKLVEEPKILKSRKAQIAIDDEVARRIEVEWNADMKNNIDWNEVVEHVQSRQSDAVRKVAQARKNMMIYLKNMVGYKMDGNGYPEKGQKRAKTDKTEHRNGKSVKD